MSSSLGLCAAICKSGKNKGHPCGNKAKFEGYCGVHKTGHNVTAITTPIPTDSAVGMIGTPLAETDRDISHMNMRISLNKLNFDVIKSGLHKAGRRGLVEAAMNYAIEGDLYCLCEVQGKARGNRTNLVNRLRIMLVEDVFAGEVVIAAEKLFSAWEAERKGVGSRKYLLSIVQLLTKSRKIRLMSDLKVFLLREDYRHWLGSQYDTLFNGWNSGAAGAASLERCKVLLEQGNPNCLYWYQQSGDERGLWLMLQGVGEKRGNPRLLAVLRSLQNLQGQLGRAHKERYLYSMAGITYLLFYDRIDWNFVVPEGLTFTDDGAATACAKSTAFLPPIAPNCVCLSATISALIQPPPP